MQELQDVSNASPKREWLCFTGRFFLLILIVIFLPVMPLSSLAGGNEAPASPYPVSAKLIESAARRIVAELEKKTEFRYAAAERGDVYASWDSAKKKAYLKVPWLAGEREPVAVYLVQERGTNARPEALVYRPMLRARGTVQAVIQCRSWAGQKGEWRPSSKGAFPFKKAGRSRHREICALKRKGVTV